MAVIRIKLTTAVEKILDNVEIPVGTTGDVIDMTVLDGKVDFFLEFVDLDTCEWYSQEEVEETDDCVINLTAKALDNEIMRWREELLGIPDEYSLSKPSVFEMERNDIIDCLNRKDEEDD